MKTRQISIFFALMIAICLSIDSVLSAQELCIRGTMPTWSPANDRLVFVTGIFGESEIWQRDLHLETSSPIMSRFERQWAPSWSSTRAYIAFLSKQGESVRLEVFDQENTLPESQANPSNWATSYEWSPIDNRLTLTSLNEDDIDVWIWDPIVDENQNLTVEMEGAFKLPFWSDDGTLVAFTSMDDTQLWLAEVETGLVSPILIDNVSNKYIGLDFSPDGQHLLVLSYTQGEIGYELVLISIETGLIVGLFSSPSRISSTARYAPDGQQIAFISGTSDDRELVILDVENDNIHRVKPSSFNIGSSFSWSPDSERIAFEGYTEDNSDIYIVDFQDDSISNITLELECESR